jgi:glycosyltransferase involved in cell wall biosynthesis
LNLLCVVYGDETHASSRCRVFQFRPHLAAQGIDTRVVVWNSRRVRRFEGWLDRPGLLRRAVGFLYYRAAWPLGLTRLGPRMRIARRLHDADLVLCHNVLLAPEALDEVRGRLVFDFVDAIYLAPKTWPAERLRAQLAAADLVIVENEQNETYARQAGATNILQIVGPIDCGRYQPRPPPEAVVLRPGETPPKPVSPRLHRLTSRARRPDEATILGWIGLAVNRPHLASIKPVLEQLVLRYPRLHLETIGLDRPLFASPRCINRPWSLTTELEDLARFDIGLMPLPDDDWARGKGGYKLLQYMALGIPAVASPVGVNAEILTPETGIPAATSDEWRAALTRLIEDADLRRTLGQAARRRAVAHYSHEAATPRLVAALQHLKK